MSADDWMGPCPECCDPCGILNSKSTLSMAVSGVSVCPCFITSGTNSRLVTAMVNGVFTLTGGGGSWNSDVINGTTVKIWIGNTACSGSPDAELMTDLFINLSCGGGILTMSMASTLGLNYRFFAGSSSSGFSILNGLTTCGPDPILPPGFGEITGTGGAATISW